mgnify:CR=1 FL=1
MIHSLVGKNSPLDRIQQRRKVSIRSGGSTAEKSHSRGMTSHERALVEQILSSKIDFIDSPEFYTEDAERRIYDEAPEVRRPDVSWYRPLMDDLTPSSNRAFPSKSTGTVLLTSAEERVLFLQYNYARYRVSLLQEEVGSREPTEEQARELLRWSGTARRYREQIAETNLALVLAMAKRTRMSEVDFADLVSEGNMALLRSVDKFDCDRGFKFSTYACRAILKAFSRQGVKLSKYRQRFPTDFDPALEKSNHLENVRRDHELESADEVRHIVINNLAGLSQVEETVIHHRFGLEVDGEHTPLTLEQVGQIIGVTKERVRQIQNKALEKIRVCFEESRSDEEEDAQLTGTPN